jgi:hypothetical protein
VVWLVVVKVSVGLLESPFTIRYLRAVKGTDLSFVRPSWSSFVHIRKDGDDSMSCMSTQ